ncbi:Uncharacterised protein [uncultured archaeon]|nr:Uncharacterised protein [uncultured archaeon]
MHNAYHSHACHPHICEHVEILCLPDLIVNGIIGSDKQHDICCLFHVPLKGRVLGYGIGHLEVAGRLHCLHDKILPVQEFAYTCRKRGFSRARRSCNKDAALAFHYPVLEFLSHPVIIKTHDRDGSYGCDLHPVRKGGLRHCYSH